MLTCKSVKIIGCSLIEKKLMFPVRMARFFTGRADSHVSDRSRLPPDGRTLADFLISAHQNGAGAQLSRQREATQTLLERQRDHARRRPTVGASESVLEALRHLGHRAEQSPAVPYKVLLETYGCAMNVSDSEIVASLLAAHPAWFQMIDERDPASATQADIVLLNTCAIREKPEARVLQRLCMLRAEEQRRGSGWPRRILGLLGCMAERLKTRLLSETPSKRLVDLVIGPDGYRDLPLLLQGLLGTMDPQRYAYHTQLSLEETYADIAPLRHRNRITAYLSIMRGCNNHCAFCIVPQTRGPERSRDPDSICREVEHLGDQGFRELVLLGQNVNSYRYIEDSSSPRIVTFAALLQRVCEIADQYPMRIRFTSPHPKDFSDDILDLYAKFAPRTLCRQIHVPVQSGSTAVLQRMRRGYTREEYLDLIQRIRDKVGGDVALSTDIISGFCDETEEEHAETLSLMDRVRFDQAFMFAYSERERTIAARLYTDNIPSEVKLRRLGEIITKQLSISAERARALIGTRQRVLIDEAIQRNAGEDPNTAGHEEHTPWSWIGRTESNRKVRIIPGKIRDPANCLSECQQEARLSPGDWADVRITSLHGHRLAGELVS